MSEDRWNDGDCRVHGVSVDSVVSEESVPETDPMSDWMIGASDRLFTVGVVSVMLWGAAASIAHAVSGAVWLGLLAAPLVAGAVTDLRFRQIHDVTSAAAMLLILGEAFTMAGWSYTGQVMVVMLAGGLLFGLAWRFNRCGAGDVGHGAVTAGVVALVWADPVVAGWAGDDWLLRLSVVMGHAAATFAAATLMLTVFTVIERKRRGRLRQEQAKQTDGVDDDAILRAAGPLATILGPAAYTLLLLPNPAVLSIGYWIT